MATTSLTKKLSQTVSQATKVACVAVVATLSTATASMAGSLSYSNTTVGGPTWLRPNAAGTAVTTQEVSYHLQPFFVDTSGAYDFLSVQDYDGYLFLYENSFNPFDQLTNFIVGNDDFPGIGQSGFNGISLAANLSYFLVTSAFANGQEGTFTNTITGVGDITLGDPSTPIPTPAMLPAMIGACIAALRKVKQEDEA